jgi:hypothetical protein
MSTICSGCDKIIDSAKFRWRRDTATWYPHDTTRFYPVIDTVGWEHPKWGYIAYERICGDCHEGNSHYVFRPAKSYTGNVLSTLEYGTDVDEGNNRNKIFTDGNINRWVPILDTIWKPKIQVYLTPDEYKKLQELLNISIKEK